MYQAMQRIEYANGIIATVVTTWADGHFIIQTSEGFAACWFDIDPMLLGEEVWCFINEENPFYPTLAEAGREIAQAQGAQA